MDRLELMPITCIDKSSYPRVIIVYLFWHLRRFMIVHVHIFARSVQVRNRHVIPSPDTGW